MLTANIKMVNIPRYLGILLFGVMPNSYGQSVEENVDDLPLH